MTTTNFRLAAVGIAALLGIGMTAAPSAAATVSSASATEPGELVPFHAGHDHGRDEAKSDKGKDGKKAGKKKDGGKGKGKGKGTGKGEGKKAGHDHGGHSH